MRRVLCVAAMVILGAMVGSGPAATVVHAGPGTGSRSVSDAQPSPTTDDTLAGTTLEAEGRGDEGSPAPWLIGSAVAAAAAVAIGGSLLKRRMG